MMRAGLLWECLFTINRLRVDSVLSAESHNLNTSLVQIIQLTYYDIHNLIVISPHVSSVYSLLSGYSKSPTVIDHPPDWLFSHLLSRPRNRLIASAYYSPASLVEALIRNNPSGARRGGISHFSTREGVGRRRCVWSRQERIEERGKEARRLDKKRGVTQWQQCEYYYESVLSIIFIQSRMRLLLSMVLLRVASLQVLLMKLFTVCTLKAKAEVNYWSNSRLFTDRSKSQRSCIY